MRSPVSAAGRPRRGWSLAARDCCSIQAGMALLACERDREESASLSARFSSLPKRTADGVRLPMRFKLGRNELFLGRE